LSKNLDLSSLIRPEAQDCAVPCSLDRAALQLFLAVIEKRRAGVSPFPTREPARRGQAKEIVAVLNISIAP
jgi:hypothetical protein